MIPNHLTLRELRMARKGALRQCGARIPDLWVIVLLHLFPGLTISEIIRDLVWSTITELFDTPHEVMRKLLFSKLYRRFEATLDVLRHPNNAPNPPEAAEQLLLPWHMQEAA